MSLVVLTIGVGLHSLAVKHYERVLDIVERRTRTNPDVGPIFLAMRKQWKIMFWPVPTGYWTS
jgi:hypothetical protein